ncbi:hypothetical protein AAVH_25103 [Aphelenchoides avenae]|nr:hypothetical protein AAVH_25103 [Aphelenchus avenae]
MAAVFMLLAILAVFTVPSHSVSTRVYTEGGVTLKFIDNSTGLNPVTQCRMVFTFFTVYPKQARTYNTAASKSVTFVIDPTFGGVAATGGNVVYYSRLTSPSIRGTSTS